VRMHPVEGARTLRKMGYDNEIMIKIVQHSHENFSGTGYPDGLKGDQISDIVRLTTIVDIYAALVEKRAYRLPFTHNEAFATLEKMGGKLDYHLLHAFRPVALGTY